MDNRQQSVKTQNIYNALKNLEESLKTQCQIPKDLFNQTDYFSHSDHKLQMVLHVFNKILKKFNEMDKELKDLKDGR